MLRYIHKLDMVEDQEITQKHK